MDDKLTAELDFWRGELVRYRQWFAGELELYGQPYPGNGRYSDAVTAWRREYQEPLYLEQLMLVADSLAGLDVLEIGPGPVTGIGAFKRTNTMFAVDPLAVEYIGIGFPGLGIVAERAESLSYFTDSFDAVVAVNSLDHVDDIEAVAWEILRVLRPGGKLAFAVDHHEPRECEPVELTDTYMEYLFPGIKKLRQVGERVLWRNF